MRSSLRATFAVAAAAAVVITLTEPATRTAGYARLVEWWHANWPSPHGAYLPLRFASTLETLRIAPPVRVQVDKGVNLFLDPRDVVSRSILATGFWERDTVIWIDQHLPAGGTFIDVGAHIGFHSLKAAQRVGTAGHVLSVEPNPATLRELRENVASSKVPQIAIEPVACSDRRATLDLFASNRSNTGMASLSSRNAARDDEGTRSYKVEAVPLDELVERQGLTRVDVIKIDVEGAETMVLRGAAKTIARFHPVVVMEMLDDQLRAMNSSVLELELMMTQAGYQRGRKAEDNVEWVPLTITSSSKP
ncbi:MAG: FkbM family methyltransferase [Bryobacteraceae bacterium]